MQKDIYNKTGKIQLSVEEQLRQTFGRGNFRDAGSVPSTMASATLSEQITVRQSPIDQSHTAGFDAWMRARGDAAGSVFTADTIADKYGVVKGSYTSIALPSSESYQVKCIKAGPAKESLELASEPLPAALEWGEVLVTLQLAPINPADLYTARTGGMYGDKQSAVPCVAGHDGVGVVTKVRKGVKDLAHGDWVVPAVTHLGSWRTLAVWKEADLLKLPKETLPIEHAAVFRELCLAYRLLEDHGNLKPGDCVILNAANSTVGRVIIQLCHLLQLRCVAVVRECEQPLEGFVQLANRLKALGASLVIQDSGSLKVELEKVKFFAKPKLGLDCVGGASALRLSDALAQGGQLVIYGCMGGKTPSWPWQSWVFKDLQVKGFNLRKWILRNSKQLPTMLDALGKLVMADKLQVAYTEYSFPAEFCEALDHAMSAGKGTKILLRFVESDQSPESNQPENKL
ncbi:TPA: hypothetical protein ACH3X2_005711 [Trebouxia sp. C0005]